MPIGQVMQTVENAKYELTSELYILLPEFERGGLRCEARYCPTHARRTESRAPAEYRYLRGYGSTHHPETLIYICKKCFDAQRFCDVPSL